MSNVEQVKKELLEECDKFISFFHDKSKSHKDRVPSILAINKSIFVKLQEVLKEGNEVDKKEALIAFARVSKVFGDIANQITASMGISSEAMKPLMDPKLLKGNPFIKPEQMEMIRKVGEDLEKLAKQSLGKDEK
jgi:cell division GTPase FtsZ